MRHRLRYERGGASHASCRHRNLVKLKCVSLNVSGLQDVGKFVRFCQVAKKWAADGKAQVLCLQEHNLHPDKEDEHIRIAQSSGFTAIIGYASAAADGVHRGGSMVMLNEQDTQLKQTYFKEGSITRVSLEWQGREYDIASIYAPSKILKRLDFFSHLAQRLTTHTIAGGDWNCVTDVTLDVKSRNPLSYPNIGASQLAKVCEKFNIYDYRRDQLGTGFEATRTEVAS